MFQFVIFLLLSRLYDDNRRRHVELIWISPHDLLLQRVVWGVPTGWATEREAHLLHVDCVKGNPSGGV